MVTPQQAEDALRAFWPLREAALTSCGLATLELLDTGTARIGDVNRARCGCLNRRSPGEIEEARLFVPRRTRFPATFVAVVHTRVAGDVSWAEVMAFTRPSARDHWRLALATGYAGTREQPARLPRPFVDDDGYTLPPDRRSRAAAARLPAQLARYWRTAKLTGRVPENPFRPSYWTTEAAQRFTQVPQGGIEPEGLRLDVAVAVNPADPFVEVLAEEGEFACGVVRVTAVFRAGPDVIPYQGPGRRDWGPQLAPGEYESVTRAGVSQTCFVVPPDGGPAMVLGGDHQNEAVTTGVPRRG